MSVPQMGGLRVEDSSGRRPVVVLPILGKEVPMFMIETICGLRRRIKPRLESIVSVFLRIDVDGQTRP